MLLWRSLTIIFSGKNLATALRLHGIEPGSLIPVESQILSTEPKQTGYTIFYIYLKIGSLHIYSRYLYSPLNQSPVSDHSDD